MMAMMSTASQPTTPMQQDTPEGATSITNTGNNPGDAQEQARRALKACFATALRTDTVIQVFGPYIASQEEERIKQSDICARRFRDHYNSFQAHPDGDAQREELMEHLADYVYSLRSPRYLRIIFAIIGTLVKERAFQESDLARLCRRLVESQHLKLRQPHHWCHVFTLLDQVVQIVHYKSCQHLLINILFKMAEVPFNAVSSSRREIKIVAQVVNRLLDRDTPLLPAYISLNEIRQIFEKDPPFWPLSKSMAKLEASFKPLSSFITLKCHRYIYPFVQYQTNGVSNINPINWQLDPVTFCWSSMKLNKLPVPHRDYCQKQFRLLNYLMSQRCTLETILSILRDEKNSRSSTGGGPSRPHNLDVVIVKLIVSVMNTQPSNPETRALFWQHLQQLVLMSLFNRSIRLNKIMELLKVELVKPGIDHEMISKSRDNLMWLLLQYISGAVHPPIDRPSDRPTRSIEDFLLVIDLFNFFYPDETISMPHHDADNYILALSPLCIFVHLKKGAQRRPEASPIAMPHSLQQIESVYYQYERAVQEITSPFDNRLILMVNMPIGDGEQMYLANNHLVQLLNGQHQIQFPGTNCIGNSQTRPLSIKMLDSITLSAKMRLSKDLLSAIFTNQQQQQQQYPSPGVVLTFSRCNIYSEIGQNSATLPSTLNDLIRENNYARLQIAVEILKYQLSFFQAEKIFAYLSPLLHCLNTITNIQLANSIRDLCITYIPQLMTTKSFLTGDETSKLVSDSEELNKSIILALAQGVKTTNSETMQNNNAAETLIAEVLQRTPHLSFPHHTLVQFPTFMREYLEPRMRPVETDNIMSLVNDEFRNFQHLYQQNRQQCAARFADPQCSPVFICIVWRILQQENQLPSIVYDILDQFNFSQLSSHIRTFSDFIINEFQAVGNDENAAMNYIDILIRMIWDYQIISLDMFIHILTLRSYTVCDVIIIIQLVITTRSDNFTNRVAWVDQNWTQENSFESHLSYHRQFRDSFNLDVLASTVEPPVQYQHQTLPSYASNVCFKMIPVLDQYFHRLFEMEMEMEASMSPLFKPFQDVLQRCCSLYRFHPKPITYLYQTLYYYPRLSHNTKRTFAITLVNTLNSTDRQRNQNFPTYAYLSDAYMAVPESEFNSWTPDLQYYMQLIYKLVQVIDGVGSEPDFDPTGFDWRFHEFSNPIHLRLYSICIELMALANPPPQEIGQNLFNIVTNMASPITTEELPKWFNAVGLILSHLPTPYSTIISQTIITTLANDKLLEPCPQAFPFDIFNFPSDSSIGRIITAIHAVWSHMSIAKLTQISSLLQDHIRPQVKTELQLLFICHLIGPFFARLEKERTRVLTDVVIELYQIILQVSQNTVIVHADTIADLLYHIKYKHVGELIKNEIRQIIIHLPPMLKEKLKFLIRSRSNVPMEQQQQQQT